MMTFVRRFSKGLAEITRNKASEVQFIHESVRDYLLNKYQERLSGVSHNFVGHSHEFLKDCCLAQLNASISQNVDIPALLPQGCEAVELRKSIMLKFPFLKYSITNVSYHANVAQQNAIKQAGFLADFPLRQWVFLNNALQKHKIRRYKESVSMLYILAERNLAELVRIHPYKEMCFKVKDERYGPPFFAALATGNDQAIHGFLDICSEAQPFTSPLNNLCQIYRQNRKKWDNFGSSFSFRYTREIWSYVAEYNDEILLLVLIELGECKLDSKDGIGRTPLSWAAEYGSEAIVKLLLKTSKVEADSRDKDGQTPLIWAASNGHEAIVKLLLETGKVEADSKNKNGWTPLMRAALNGHEVVVKLLLETGKVEVNSKDKTYGRTPLLWAANNGYEAVFKLLLETGKVEPNSKDIDGRTLLSCAARKGHETIVKLLLETGKVETDWKDKNSCRTPLLWAAHTGQEAIVKLLLETGKVEPDWKDFYGITALLCAAERGYETIVKLLLKTGKVEADSQDKYGRTPLSRAAEEGFEGVVKLLQGHVQGHVH